MLDESQRGMVATKLATLRDGQTSEQGKVSVSGAFTSSTRITGSKAQPARRYPRAAGSKIDRRPFARRLA